MSAVVDQNSVNACKRASTGVSTFAIPQANHNQKLQRIFKIFFPTLQKKNKTPDTQARQKSTRQMTQTDDIKMVVTHDRQERQPITAVWRNGGFSASYDSFVVKQTLVLRINICGKNPPLRQAAKR
jgi:hypothetical protein